MKVCVVGGGPAGVISAIELSRNNIDVILIEKNNRILKKLLATGNGRCNYTNINVNISDYYCKNNFVENVLNSFSKDALIDYFRIMGIEPTIENRGKIFPVTLKSNTVVNTLLEELEENRAEVITEEEVVSIDKGDNFILKTHNRTFNCDYVIFAPGGMAMPSSGSNGKSYKVLENLGHSKLRTFPGLTQIKLSSPFLKQLSGVKVVGKVNLILDKDVVEQGYGDLLFTDYGISGPPVLDLSRRVNLEGKDKEMFLEMPLINNIENIEDFRNILYGRFYSLNHFSFERWLSGIVDKKFINYISKTVNIDKTSPMYLIEEYRFEEVIRVLLKSRFSVIGTKGFENAQVTCGGIDTEEIDSSTMESKYVPGLYIAGEVMDVDGKCGGYNLQWAFSSGIVAARDIISKNQ